MEEKEDRLQSLVVLKVPQMMKSFSSKISKERLEIANNHCSYSDWFISTADLLEFRSRQMFEQTDMFPIS